MVLTTAQSLGILVGAILTLMMYTFLYKDNIFYKFGEHLYVGISVGYMVNLTYWNVFYPQFIVPAIYQQETVLIIPAILGLMMLSRFIRQVAWLSRTPMAFIIGVGSGLAIPAVLNSSILIQIHSTIRVLWFTTEQYAAMSPFEAFWETMSLWIIFVGVLSVLFYLRQFNGVCGYTKPSESKYDYYVAGHSSTSISLSSTRVLSANWVLSESGSS